jgi:hypothetical protein
VEFAEFQLVSGAGINACDLDHESTPAQYMLRVGQKRYYPLGRQDVARYLVSRGCWTEILMAAELGDADLVRQQLDADAGCIRKSVSEECFPKRDPRARSTSGCWGAPHRAFGGARFRSRGCFSSY